VYLPRNYDDVREAPALYFFDGQNVFEDAGSFAGGWRAHEAVDRLSPRAHHVPVLISVDHGGAARVDELAPFRARGNGGKADTLLEAIAKAVMPIVHARFRLIPGPIGRAVCGSSMGGLAALYAHARRPDLFGGAIAMSSSFWFGGGAIYGAVERTGRPTISRVYLDVGGREGGPMRAGTDRMRDLFLQRGYGPRDLAYRYDPRARHHEIAWRKRLPAALRFMFRKAA
jgi:predicted alpha/beta superfamily hydrolase